MTDPDLEHHLALANMPKVTETEQPSAFVATFHDWRAHRLEQKGHYDEAICHLLQGTGHKDSRFRRAAAIRMRQGLYHDAVRYHVAAIREGWGGWNEYRNLAECLEHLGAYEDALELYFMYWGRLGHHEKVYKQYRQYRQADPKLRLSDQRFRQLVEGMEYVCKNWRYGTYDVTGDEVAAIERELQYLDNGGLRR